MTTMHWLLCIHILVCSVVVHSYDCGTGGNPEEHPVVKSYMDGCRSRSCETITCDLPYRVNYVAYHVGNDVITVDGQITEEAWQNVAWTRRFIDIQGEDGESPYFDTYAKMRWDDTYLYVAAYFQETDIWANKTVHDTRVFLDNAFEVFIDADWSTHSYKEFQVNAIGTTWDLLMTKPYINGGSNISKWEMPSMQQGVYLDGTVNDPSDRDVFWTIELALPFQNLVENTTLTYSTPFHNDRWRINLSRVQYEVMAIDGVYHKVPGSDAHYWVWSSQDAVAMHLPEKYGIVEFSRDPVNTTTHAPDTKWPAYSALIDTYYALKSYQATLGPLTSNLSRLNLPPYTRTDTCVNTPVIDVDGGSFLIKAKPKDAGQPTGTMRDDRYVEFKWIN